MATKEGGPSSSQLVQRWDEVFLSHAGEQKAQFVSCLHSALKRQGLSVFMDVERLVIGQTALETIRPAVHNAKVVVFVLTLDFVGKWYPMQELRWVLEQGEQGRLKSVVVFCGKGVNRVACGKLGTNQPGDDEIGQQVRQQVEVIQEKMRAGATEDGVLNNELYKQWCTDLVDVSKLGNIDQNDLYSRLTFDSDLLDRVVNEVCSKLGHKLMKLPTWKVNLEGEESLLEQLVVRLNMGGRCGLYGEGGIGKTTLAKSIYNRLVPLFGADNTAVIKVGQSIIDDHLRDCANNLFEQLGREKTVICLDMLNSPLAGRKVLLLFDDLWSCQQVKMLLKPFLCGIGPGSVVLCTSRNKDVLRELLDSSECHRVQPLNADDALQLFRWHAWRSQEFPLFTQELQEKEKQLCEKCGGLPLALEVMGSYIRRQEDLEDPKVWHCACLRLIQGRESLMQQVLGLSMDTLPYDAKEMLYDVAWLLRGEPILYAEAAWEGIYHLTGESAYDLLQELLNSSLCKVDEDGRLVMHDLVCDLVRTHTREMCKSNLKDQRWFGDAAFQQLEGGEMPTRARCAELLKRTMWPSSLRAMENLQFLRLSNPVQDPIECADTVDKVQLRKRYHQERIRAYVLVCEGWTQCSFLRGLVWLQLSGCHLQHSPQQLPCTNLHVLCMECCDAPPLCLEQMSQLSQLRILDLLGCEWVQTLPDSISRLTCLRAINLKKCINLGTLPAGISCLKGLEELDLTECFQLGSITVGISCLTKLQRLKLQWCEQLTHLPEGISCLICLRQLNVGACRRLEAMPEGISRLSMMSRLDMAVCGSLKTLPDGIGRLRRLHTFDFGACRQLQSLPEGISTLGGLHVLDLRGCEQMHSLPNGVKGLSNLQALILAGCGQVQQLPESISGLGSLRTLHMRYCKKLECLPDGISGLTSLQTLILAVCGQLQSLPEGISRLSSLKSLDLMQCVRLQQLPEGIRGLHSLQTLNLEDCRQLQGIPEGISGLSSLQTLVVAGCRELVSISEGISGLSSLRVPDLRWCRSLELKGLPEAIVSLSSLQSLDLGWCSKLQGLPEGISGLCNLTSLKLGYCTSLQRLPEGISGLTSLQTLDLRGCNNLQSLPEGIGSLSRLKCLNRNWWLQGLPEGISDLSNQTSLDLYGCMAGELRSPFSTRFELMDQLQLQHLDWNMVHRVPESISSDGTLAHCSLTTDVPESISSDGTLAHGSLTTDVPESISSDGTLAHCSLTTDREGGEEPDVNPLQGRVRCNTRQKRRWKWQHLCCFRTTLDNAENRQPEQ